MEELKMDNNRKSQLKLCKACKYAGEPTEDYPYSHCKSKKIACGTSFDKLYQMGLAREGIHFK